MGEIKLYDYQNSFEPTYIRMARASFDDIANIPSSGTITMGGNTYSVTKTSGAGYTEFEFESNTAFLSTWDRVLAVMTTIFPSLDRTSFKTSNIFAWFPAEMDDRLVNTNNEFVGSDDTYGYPLLETTYDPNRYIGPDHYGPYFGTISISPSSGTSYDVGPISEPDFTQNNLAGYLAFATGDPDDVFGGYVYGCYKIESWANYGSPSHPYTYIKFYSSSQVSASLIDAVYEVDKGENGFKPTGNTASSTIGGGSHSGGLAEYETDELEQPAEPTGESAIGAGGFINCYEMTPASLINFGKCLFSSTLLSALANLFINPLDGVVALNLFPCEPSSGLAENVKLLNHTCTLEDLGIGCTGSPLTNQFKTFDFGDLDVAEMFESFLDYDASSFELYLPFIGSVDIPVGEVMGGTINVQYTIDFFTGMCVANVLCTKTMTDASGINIPQYAQHSYQGNCAVNIPLTAVNYGNMIGSLINACSSGMKSGVGGAIASLSESAVAGGFKPSVSTKGTIGANAGFCAIRYPYITITRPITAEPESYQDVMGYPSYVDSTLGEMSGLCICDNIDLRTITGATDSEIDEIMSICKSGIHV